LPVSARKHDEFVTVLTKWRKMPVNLKPWAVSG
jgi:hypothetical protein